MTDRLEKLICRNFGGTAAQLRVDAYPIDMIAEEFGTPLYVYSASVLDSSWRRLRTTLPDNFTICYSIKANPNPVIIAFFVARGCGIEIASEGELHLALLAGAPAESIIYAGPGKVPGELELALKERIGEFHVESLIEIRRLAAIATRLGIHAPVAIRVNPGPAALGGAMRMGGGPGPFGIDEEDLDATIDAVVGDSHLELCGLHVYAGTQILDWSVLLAQYQTGLRLGERCARRLGRPLATIDFGGGFGIPYFKEERELDLHALQARIAELMAGTNSSEFFEGTRFLVEPGRYLVGEAGIYITRVLDVKKSRGKVFVVVDGGMNHHLAASGNLGQVLKRNFPMTLVNRLDEPATDKVDVVGPLCTPLDVLARDVLMPRPAPGDLVGVFQSGAYARTASPLGFLSHRTPPEVLVTSGRPRLIRRRGRVEDLTADLADTTDA